MYEALLDHDEAGEAPPEKDVEVRGAPGILFDYLDMDPADVPQEVLIDGPAGTGKTRGVLEWLERVCWEFPGIRVLLARQTRKSMTESILVTWEDDVLGKGHPAITGERKRNDRQDYTFPNGSHIVLVGLDKPENTFSMEFDIIIVEEAVQTTPVSWELLARCNRNNKMPFQIRLAVTNPKYPMHWLIRRARANPIMERLISRHEDNPAYYAFDEETGQWGWTALGRKYMDNLRHSMSGSTLDRLFKGIWSADEGLVYENWDEAVHCLPAQVRIDVRERVDDQENPRLGMPFKDENGSFWIDFEDSSRQSIEILWTIGAQDWGDASPGCQLVFGVDREFRMYLLSQVYRTRKTTDWWAEVTCEHVRMFDMIRIVCDSAETDRIDIFNDRLGTPGGREEERIALKANKSRKTGISEMQARIGNVKAEGSDEVLIPAAFFTLKNTHRHGIETRLENQRKPYSFETEIGGYAMRENEEGKPERDEPDPTCPDHAMDASRYACMYVWKKDLSREIQPPRWEERPGTMGYLVGHDELEDWWDDE